MVRYTVIAIFVIIITLNILRVVAYLWCSDDVVIEQVKAAGVMPMVVKDSVVRHLGSQTLLQQPEAVQNDWKWRNVYIYNTKYGKDKFNDHPAYKVWLQNNKNNLEVIYVAK